VDVVEFRFAPNPGEPAKPVARTASGGELSRILLALKAVLTAADRTPSLIFDEVDVGVGGRSGGVLGEKLAHLARRHQVLCVTHLPQIAAWGDSHFFISKHVRDGRTITTVAALDEEARVRELAQMLGGVTAHTLEQGRALQTAAARWKRDGLAAIPAADESLAHRNGKSADAVPQPPATARPRRGRAVKQSAQLPLAQQPA
jgi:DNA repair protein RecN (Recombination protein N)